MNNYTSQKHVKITSLTLNGTSRQCHDLEASSIDIECELDGQSYHISIGKSHDGNGPFRGIGVIGARRLTSHAGGINAWYIQEAADTIFQPSLFQPNPREGTASTLQIKHLRLLRWGGWYGWHRGVLWWKGKPLLQWYGGRRGSLWWKGKALLEW